MKGGQARDILLYNKYRVFAFVLALGEVDDLKYAAAAGAISYGFPVDRRHRHPADPAHRRHHLRARRLDALRRDRGRRRPGARRALVQRCIEVRGVKIRITKVPIPVAYGSAFEGERVAQGDMRVEFGGKRSWPSSICAWRDARPGRGRQDQRRRARHRRASREGAHMTLGIVVEVAGRKMQRTSSRCSSARSTTSSTAPRASSTSASATSPGSASARRPPPRASACEHFGDILHARLHADFGAIVDKVQVTIYTERAAGREAGWTRRARPTTTATCAWPSMTDAAVDVFYSLHALPVLRSQPRLRHHPRARWASAAPTTGSTARPPSRSTRPAPTSRSRRASVSTPRRASGRRPTHSSTSTRNQSRRARHALLDHGRPR